MALRAIRNRIGKPFDPLLLAVIGVVAGYGLAALWDGLHPLASSAAGALAASAAGALTSLSASLGDIGTTLSAIASFVVGLLPLGSRWLESGQAVPCLLGTPDCQGRVNGLVTDSGLDPAVAPSLVATLVLLVSMVAVIAFAAGRWSRRRQD